MAGFDIGDKRGTGEEDTASRGFIPNGTVSALSVSRMMLELFANAAFLTDFFPYLSVGSSEPARGPFSIRLTAANLRRPGYGKKSPDGLGDSRYHQTAFNSDSVRTDERQTPLPHPIISTNMPLPYDCSAAHPGTISL